MSNPRGSVDDSETLSALPKYYICWIRILYLELGLFCLESLGCVDFLFGVLWPWALVRFWALWSTEELGEKPKFQSISSSHTYLFGILWTLRFQPQGLERLLPRIGRGSQYMFPLNVVFCFWFEAKAHGRSSERLKAVTEVVSTVIVLKK